MKKKKTNELRLKNSKVPLNLKQYLPIKKRLNKNTICPANPVLKKNANQKDRSELVCIVKEKKKRVTWILFSKKECKHDCKIRPVRVKNSMCIFNFAEFHVVF